MSVLPHLQDWPPRDEGIHRYLLLDGAQISAPVQLLPRLPLAARHVRLFDGVLADGSADTSVYLAQLAGDAPMASLLRSLSGAAKYTGAVTFIDTPLPQGELSQRLSRRLDARLPNGKEFLARFYDGRVLPLLWQVLTDSQRESFFSLGTAWWYVAPHLAWETLGLFHAEVDPYAPPLQLDDAQRRRLIDDAYPYTLIDHFTLTDPELLDRVPPEDRYRFIRNCMRMAAEHGVRDGKRLVMVCTWALLSGDTFFHDPAWQQRLEDLGAGRRNTREISDEVWPQEEESWDE